MASNNRFQFPRGIHPVMRNLMIHPKPGGFSSVHPKSAMTGLPVENCGRASPLFNVGSKSGTPMA